MEAGPVSASILPMKPISETYNIDCLEYMRTMPDGFFDLAVVDPPYGIGRNWNKDRSSKFYGHRSTYDNATIPGKEYFDELFRVSRNQIIWGANYYTEFLPARNSWIVWDKSIDYTTQHMSEGELAWTSFNVPLRIAHLIWNGFCRCESRSGIHPHEKPIALYKWIFDNYTAGGGAHIGHPSRERFVENRRILRRPRLLWMRDRQGLLRCPAEKV